MPCELNGWMTRLSEVSPSGQDVLKEVSPSGQDVHKLLIVTKVKRIHFSSILSNTYSLLLAFDNNMSPFGCVSTFEHSTTHI